jgi:hypothetical protein
MKTFAIFSFVAILALLILAVGVVNPPAAEAVPSYARQTGLACSGCHYAPPELNPAGRRFKLLGYVDKADDTKTVHSDSGKKHAALDLLASLPLSVMFETSYTQTKKAVPATQNGTLEFPQDVSLFLSGAWTSHVGSFVQVTYDTQDDHFTIDNSDVRYANLKKLSSGKEFIYGLDINNNPGVEDLWNDTPAWGFPWLADDFAPTPNASPILRGNLGQDVAGFGGYAMYDNHLYFDAALYRSGHVGLGQPNPGAGLYNIQGVAPYWRIAWQQSGAKTQFEVGTYGMHLRSTPNGITGAEDTYTDYAFDTQLDQTIRRTDVLSLRATFIRENSDLTATAAALQSPIVTHHLDTLLANAEYHFGNRVTTTLGWFNTSGTADGALYPVTGDLAGSFNGDPKSNGYIFSASYWPWQNLQLGAQYTAYTRFNGAGTNYDGNGRNASDNNTFYLVARFLF